MLTNVPSAFHCKGDEGGVFCFSDLSVASELSCSGKCGGLAFVLPVPIFSASFHDGDIEDVSVAACSVQSVVPDQISNDVAAVLLCTNLDLQA